MITRMIYIIMSTRGLEMTSYYEDERIENDITPNEVEIHS